MVKQIQYFLRVPCCSWPGIVSVATGQVNQIIADGFIGSLKCAQARAVPLKSPLLIIRSLFPPVAMNAPRLAVPAERAVSTLIMLATG
jgi:hypothetical protein